MGNDRIEKLKGRENYDDWKFAAKSHMVIKGHWSCITGTEADPEKNLLAISALGLLIEPQNYSYVRTCETAKAAWEALEAAFEDNGVLRRMDLLKFLMRLELSDCNSMEDYVTKMTNTQQKLDKSGTKIPDDIFAQIMLSGLPEDYRPMVMAIANCGSKLTSDLVRTNLLQEVKHESNDAGAMALVSKKKQQNQKYKPKDKSSVNCFNCNEKGHYASKCPKKNTQTKDSLMLVSTSFVAKTKNATEWYIDSGASAHMTMNEENLTTLCEPKSKEIIVGNNSRLNVKCAGDIKMEISTNGGSGENVTVKDVLCIPDICANLMSVSQMAKHGKTLVFDKDSCRIFDENSDLIATAPLVEDLYRLNCALKPSAKAFVATNDKNLWHRRMGHACDDNLNKMLKSVDGVDFPNGRIEKCEVCVQGKQTRSSFKDVGNRATEVLQLIHSDVCGPMSTKSFGGARYLLTFVDDFSRKVFVYPMKQKSEVFDLFVGFTKLVENQQNKTIKTFRSDNGTEFCNKQFDSFLAKHGISRQRTAPYTPEQNGVAERMNRTIIEKVRCMLIDAGLSKQYWAEAAATASYLINRIPCREMKETTPEEIWSKSKPDLKMLRVFGCKAMVHIPKEKRQKLDSKSMECIFLGYSEQSKAYKLFNQKKKELIVSRDVVFF